MRIRARSPATLLAASLVLGAGGCAVPGTDAATDEEAPAAAAFEPRTGGDTAALEELAPEELRRLRLIATNLVAALVQIPELRPATATLQVTPPTTAWGNVVVRSLEDAGFGLQHVSADQGRNYVSYGQRFSRTDSGPVEDFTLAVGPVRLARAYVTDGGRVYPSSLMEISGTSALADIELADEVFREQGGAGKAFISGTRPAEGVATDVAVDTVAVRDYDELPLERRTAAEDVLARARRRFFETDAERSAPDLSRFERYRRTVLIFDDADTLFMGAANKRAVRLMVREFEPADLLVIRACHDADGRDERARVQAVRTEEELASHGVPAESAWIAPCVRASYRHASDDSPAPVEIIHYRPKA